MHFEFSLDYMEDAVGEYDVVFNRVCWCYCISDKSFAGKILSLVRPGGVGYLVINTERYLEQKWGSMPLALRLRSRLFFFLNDTISLKIGHVMPSHRKIERLFHRMPLRNLDLGFRDEMTVVRFRR